MREFTDEEKKWLVYHESNLPLFKHARHFKCSWKCVYANYTLMFESGEYLEIKKLARRKRKNHNALLKIRKILQRRRRSESQRTTDAIPMEAPESRPYLRRVRVIQNKS